MWHWSVDTKKFKQNHPEEYDRWELEQIINNGLRGRKLTKQLLRKYLPVLDIDPAKRNYLEYVISDITPKEYLKLHKKSAEKT